MKILDVEQGTDLWLDARAGVATASQADKLVTPARRAVSKQITAYAYKLAAERMLGRPLDDDLGGAWLERGTELEAEARAAFAFETDLEPKEVGFVLSDDGYTGCSPDGLMVEAKQGLEIKCPSAHIHIGYLMREGVPPDYLGQCQFSLYVTGFDAWHFFSHTPGLPDCHRVVYPDKKWMEACEEAVRRLRGIIDETIQALRDQGCVPASERPKVTTFAAAEGISDVSFDAMSDAMEFEY